MAWTATLRLIDKTNNTPTGITAGPVVAGDLEPFFKRFEITNRGIRKIPQSASIHLKTKFGTFARSAPDLMADDAQDLYLIELQIHQGGNNSKLFRCRLGTPTIQNDENMGYELLVVPLEGIQLIQKEFPTSFEDELVKPKEHFINEITAYNGTKGTDNPIIAYRGGNSATAIDLPDVPKRDYLKFGIVKLHDELVQVLLDLAEAPDLGGTIKDFYMDSDPDPSNTNIYSIFAEEFGLVDSGVVINPITVSAPEKEKTIQMDNLAFKNYLVGKFHPTAGTIPEANQVFRSRELRGFQRDEWSSATAYAINSIIKYTDTSVSPTVVRFFQATSAVGPSATTPDQDNPNWLEDFTRLPPFSEHAFYTIGEVVTFEVGGAINYYRAIADNGPSTTTPNLSANWGSVFFARPAARYTAFFSYTPYTSNFLDFRQNMGGIDDVELTGDYIGFFPDHNIVRANYDRDNPVDQFEYISVKDIFDTTNTPPTGQFLFNGYRVLVGTSPTGVFATHANQVAEYFRPSIPNTLNPAEWKFSKSPVNGDTVNDWKTGRILQFNGTWGAIWSITLDSGKSAIWHLVKSMQLVKGATGIPGQAIQWRHDWALTGTNGDIRNRAGRTVCGAFVYPYPRSTVTGNSGLGGQYGGTGLNAPPLPQFDANNLTKNTQGLIGWMNGITSESMGRTSTKHKKIKISYYSSEDETQLTNGRANIEFETWAVDLFGLVWRGFWTYYVNNAFQPLDIQWSLAANQNLYQNRIDELVTILGLTMPFDFFLEDIELTGLKFDWRRIRMWGFQQKESFSESGLYTASFDVTAASLAEQGQQVIGDILTVLSDIANGNWDNVASAATSIGSGTDHVLVTLDDLYDTKELYVVSDDVPPDEIRSDTVNLPQIQDYETAKNAITTIKARKKFRPKQWFITALGDVRVKFGQRITIEGDQVPGGTQELVVAEVKFIIDSNNFSMEIHAIEKFVFS